MRNLSQLFRKILIGCILLSLFTNAHAELASKEITEDIIDTITKIDDSRVEIKWHLDDNQSQMIQPGDYYLLTHELLNQNMTVSENNNEAINPKMIDGSLMLVFEEKAMNKTDLNGTIILQEEMLLNESSIKVSRFGAELLEDRVYLAGEEVVAYIGLALDISSSNLYDFILEVKVSKEFLDTSNDKFKASDLNTQNHKTIIETDTHYIVHYELGSLTSGVGIDTPIYFTTNNNTTPDQSVVTIETNILDGDTLEPLIPADIKKVVNGTLHPKTDNLTYIGHWTTAQNNQVESGKEDMNKPGYLTEDIDELDSVMFSYRVGNGQSASSIYFGNRRYEKIIFENIIPGGAVFIQEDNPGWAYDENTRIASYTYEPNGGIVLGTQTLSSSAVNLKLKFPGAKIGETLTNVVTTTFLPMHLGENESIIVEESRVTYRPIATKPVPVVPQINLSKTIQQQTYYDTEESRMSQQEWYLEVTALERINNLTLRDYNLNQNLQYVSLSFDENYLPQGDQKVDIIGVYHNNSEVVLKSHVDPKNAGVINLDPTLKEFKIKLSEGTYLEENQRFRVILRTELKVKDEPVVKIENNSLSMTGSLESLITVNNQNYRSYTSATIWYYSAVPKINITKTSLDASSTVFKGDILKYRINLQSRNLNGNHTVEQGKVIELMPQGINYVPDSAQLLLYTNIVTSMSSGAFEPEIVPNYKGTGQTALIWDVGSFSSKLGMNNSLYSYFSITYNLEVTQLTEFGINSPETFFVWDNNQEIYPQVHDTLDYYDLNENGSTSDLISGTRVSFNYIPSKELISFLYTKGSLDSEYMLPPNIGLNEMGEYIEYEVKIVNNSLSPIKNLDILDVFPYLGDDMVGIDNIKRNSTFKPLLYGAVEIDVLESNSDKYTILYTTQLPTEDLVAFYEGNHWVETVTDYREVTAIKLQLNDGASLDVNETLVFRLKFKIPEDLEDEISHKVDNSIGISTSSTLQFVSSNITTNEVVKYKVSGYVFEDFNRDSLFDQNELVFEDYPVELLDENGEIALDLNGIPYRTSTDKGGYYAFDVHRKGNYSIRINPPETFVLTNYNDDPSGSHLIFDSSPLFELNMNERAVKINAGYYRRYNILEINHEVKTAAGDDFEPDDSFEYKLYVDNEGYQGSIKIVDKKTNIERDVHVLHGLITVSANEKAVVLGLANDIRYRVVMMENDRYDQAPLNRELHGVIDRSQINLNFTSQVKIFKKDYTVTHIWVGGPLNKPNVSIDLYRNDVVIDTVVLSGKENWTHTWHNLDMNDALGNAYTYRFDLKETPKDYKKVIEDNNIINTYTKKTSVNAKINWLGGPVVKPSTSITLYKNGKAYETVLLNQKNNWSHTWDNLEIYDDKGKLIRYTITQMDVLKDYIASIEGYTITNRYTKKAGNIMTSVMNVWRNGPSIKPSVSVQLYRDGVPYGDLIWLKNGQVEYMWFNLPAHDDGDIPFTYTVRVMHVPRGYRVDYFGNMIIYTYVGGGYVHNPSDGSSHDSNRVFDPNNPYYDDPSGNYLPKTGISHDMKYLSYEVIGLGILMVLKSKKRKQQ